MENLKSLVSKANSGLTLNSKTNKRFGLGSFIAASSDQMLMTRGGVGHSRLRVGQETGGGPGVDAYTAAFSGMLDSGGGGFGGAISSMENEWNAITSSVSSTYGSFMDSAADAIGTAWDVTVIVGGAAIEFGIGIVTGISLGPAVAVPANSVDVEYTGPPLTN